MSAKSPEVRLRHILDEIDGVTAFLAGLPEHQLMTSYGHLRAAERAIQIISEAAKELPQEMRDREIDVPWQAIIRIGNLLRHEYYRIDPAILAEIINVGLPRLRPAVLRLLGDI